MVGSRKAHVWTKEFPIMILQIDNEGVVDVWVEFVTDRSEAVGDGGDGH